MDSTVENVRSQMRKGVLEYCILSILSRKEAYASSIIEELKAANMIVVEGTLYPLLIRQKNQGLHAGPSEEVLCDYGEGEGDPLGDGLGMAGNCVNDKCAQKP